MKVPTEMHNVMKLHPLREKQRTNWAEFRQTVYTVQWNPINKYLWVIHVKL